MTTATPLLPLHILTISAYSGDGGSCIQGYSWSGRKKDLWKRFRTRTGNGLHLYTFMDVVFLS